jgi:BMFP domain-containing protein YqiC
MDTPSEMDTPLERAMRADHGLDRDDMDAHHRPVTRIRRPAYKGWVFPLFGALLVGLIGLLGWGGYALSTIQAELRQLQAHVAQLEPRSAGGEAAPEETAQRLHALDQRLHRLESRTRDTAPRISALEQRPRERVAKSPSPPPALPPATQLPRNATSAPRTPQDQQADRDMRQQAAATGRLGAPVPESFGTWLAWHPAWELRWLSFQVRGQPSVYLYHITYKAGPQQRYTMYWDPERRTWQQWTLWQRVP